MNEAKLREYAKLIVKSAQMYRKDSVSVCRPVWIRFCLLPWSRKSVTKPVTSYVELIWECGPINKLSYQYATAETLGTGSELGGGAPQTDDRRSSGPHFH